MFAQVVLDATDVLQRRHEQLLQVISALGFSSCSSLSVALQPSTKVWQHCLRQWLRACVQ